MNANANDNESRPKLSEFAQIVRRSFTADMLVSYIEDKDEKIPADVVLEEIVRMVETAEGPLGD